jgi:hypothetical protein
VSTETPVNVIANLDHVVTQWMAPSYVDGGSACISSHVHVVGVSTRPSTVKVQSPGESAGVASAVRTGQSLPTSYWPGGSRTPLAPRWRPVKPRVIFAIATSLRHGPADHHLLPAPERGICEPATRDLAGYPVTSGPR